MTDTKHTPEPQGLNDILYRLSHLKAHLKDGAEVAVFRDNGWGDDHRTRSSYTIIIAGNGQIDYGEIPEGCFERLLHDGYLEHNTLITFKDRGYHKYLGPANIGYCGWRYAPLKELKVSESGMTDPAAEIAALRAELERKDARIRELETHINEHYTGAATAYIKELETQARSLTGERDKWKAKAERYREALEIMGRDESLKWVGFIARDYARAAIEEE